MCEESRLLAVPRTVSNMMGPNATHPNRLLVRTQTGHGIRGRNLELGVSVYRGIGASSAPDWGHGDQRRSPNVV